MANFLTDSQESLARNDRIFGSEHTLIGSSNRDLILKTRGKIKVLWGNRFIDIIKNGKLNTEEIEAPFIVYNTKTEIDHAKDSFAFTLDDLALSLIYQGAEYLLTSKSSDNVFVAYTKQVTNAENKFAALNNLGIVFNSKNEYKDAYWKEEIPLGMFIYILNDGMYFMNALGELVNPYFSSTGGTVTGPIILSTSQSVSLLLPRGKNIQIGNTLYSDTGITTSDLFVIGGSLSIDKDSEGKNRGIFDMRAEIKEISSDYIHSHDFVEGERGFAMYTDAQGLKVVEADKFIERNPADKTNDKIIDINGTDEFYITQYANIVDAQTLDGTTILTLDKNIFDNGDVGRLIYREPAVIYGDNQFYRQYSDLHAKAYAAYSRKSTYTPASFELFESTIRTYNSAHTAPVVNPDTGSNVDVRIYPDRQAPIIYPEKYNTTDTFDTFDFLGKITALETALSKLVAINDDNNVDITFIDSIGFEAKVTLSKAIPLANLIGKKIFKIQKSMIRMYSENDTSGTIDLYENIESLADLNDTNVNTRVGNIEAKRPDYVVPYGGIEFVYSINDYPTRGFYSRGVYIDKGVFIDGKAKNFKIDLIHPENTYMSRGVLESRDKTVKIDLTNAVDTIIKKGVIQDTGALNTLDLNNPTATTFTTGKIKNSNLNIDIGAGTIEGPDAASNAQLPNLKQVQDLIATAKQEAIAAAATYTDTAISALNIPDPCPCINSMVIDTLINENKLESKDGSISIDLKNNTVNLPLANGVSEELIRKIVAEELARICKLNNLLI